MSKLVVFWLIGGVLLLLGSWIIGHAEQNVGVPELSYALAILISFVLILAGGLCWIAVAAATKHKVS